MRFRPINRLSAAILLLMPIYSHHTTFAAAKAVSSSRKAARRCNDSNQHVQLCSAATAAPPADSAAITAQSQAPASSHSSNPIAQLLGYVKDTFVNFSRGLSQMNADHKRCNAIRAKQTAHAKSLHQKRPRGILGIQTGGITYAEYDFLKKGLVDRNKLLAVSVVMLCLPNYFVYYLWSFPDMMPSPFLAGKDIREISRERSHAVLTTLMEMEKGARVPPWSSKLNPFGKKSTERAMERLNRLADEACALFCADGGQKSQGAKMVMQRLDNDLYTAVSGGKNNKQSQLKHVMPKQILKGLGKVISADPLNKGSSPFGVGPIKHIENVALADEFLIDQSVDLKSIESNLLAEACSARLIGGPGWTDEELREGLSTWLEEVEAKPRRVLKERKGDDNDVQFNAHLARAALMCYNAVDGARDERSDGRLSRVMYQGQITAAKKEDCGSSS